MSDLQALTSKLLTIIENRNFGADDVMDTQAIYEIFKEAKGSELEAICCNLFNFASDSMARQEDRYHRQTQEKELNQLIRLLKAGHIDQARIISFLNKD